MLVAISGQLRRRTLRHLTTLSPPAPPPSTYSSPPPPPPSTYSSPPPPRAISGSCDEYFAAVHHISGIVRRDHFLERTLNRLRLPPPSSDLVLRVLRSCSANPSSSLRFFSWARSSFPSTYTPSSAEYEQLLLTLARHRRWDAFHRLCLEIRASSSSIPLPLPPFAAAIESFSAAGLIDKSVEIFNSLPRLGCAQTTLIYNSLLAALVSSRNFHGAYALIRRMIRRTVALDRRTFSILVDGWCAAGKLREAQEFLEEMSRRGFNPPVRGRDLLVDGLINAGYLESAKRLVSKMTKEGFLPDVSTFNSLLQALCNSGEIEFCVHLLHDASVLGLYPDISTYKILIPAVAKVGKIEDAFRLLYSSMDDGHKPFPSLYAGIIKALCKAGRFSDAFSFFSEMKTQGYPPNRPVYTMMLRMCVRGGKFVEAGNYLAEMMEMGLVPMPQSFNMVIDGLKHCGKHDLARRIEQLEFLMRGN